MTLLTRAIALISTLTLVGAGCSRSATNATTTTTPLPSSGTSLADVAKHNTSADCWIIVSNNVYAVTSFFSQHPGGAERIVPFCGRDATTAFLTQGGEGKHSAIADQQLAQFKVGSLNSQ